MKQWTIVPSLLADNLGETLRFYLSLGFSHTGGAPETGWIEVCRDGATLRFYDDPPIGTPKRAALSGTLYLEATDIDQLAAAYKHLGPFLWGPETMEYGLREFAMRDPNGYIIAFAEPAAEPAPILAPNKVQD